MSRISLSIIVIFVYSLFMLSCRSLSNRSMNYKVNSAEGYINFTLKIDQTSLEKLRNNLSSGRPDTCFLYYHMRVYKDLTLQFDSLSYDCLSDKKLDYKELDRFSRTLRPIIVDRSNAFVAFEPFDCALQFSLEVGQNKRGEINSIFSGYSKSFNFHSTSNK